MAARCILEVAARQLLAAAGLRALRHVKKFICISDTIVIITISITGTSSITITRTNSSNSSTRRHAEAAHLVVQKLDPSRLVNPASGWYDAPVGDVIDVHDYVEVRSPRPTWKRAAVLGEYGGLGHKVRSTRERCAFIPCPFPC